MRQVVFVSKNNNIIQINGKSYDATTGNLLSHAGSSKATPKEKSVDGVHRAPRKPAHAASRHPASSQTLMRSAVKKPSLSAKPHLKAQGHAESTVDLPKAEVLVNTSVQRLDNKRLQHAKKIHKSQLISRFGTAAPAAPQPTLYSQFVEAKAASQSHLPTQHTAKSKKTKTTADLLEQALQNATSHEQAPVKRPKLSHAKRTAGMGGAVLLAVIVLGVITSQNLPNAKLQMASAKAGFDASLPQYKPAGYSLGKLNYSDGVVATRFKSNSDSRSYTITQKQTTWDSTALLDTFVKPSDPNYQAIDSGGRTVYIYGQHNATWISGGIWYQVESNGSLSDRQLVELASSL